MTKARFVLLLLVAFIICGCAVFPVNRTYFEPNCKDGKPVRSHSCGYHRAANDSLEIRVGDMLFQISPSYKKGSHLFVSFLFQYTGGTIKVNPKVFELYNLATNERILPSKVEESSFGPDESHPYRNLWFTVEYPIRSENLDSITFQLPVGSVLRNDQLIEFSQFRFKKNTIFDIYYGSINC